MSPDQEKNMRSEIAEFGTSKLIDLAISLQNTIDIHVNETTGMRLSINRLSEQVEIFQQRDNDETRVGAVELEGINNENEALRDRVNKLQELNEKLQAKLLS